MRIRLQSHTHLQFLQHQQYPGDGGWPVVERATVLVLGLQIPGLQELVAPLDTRPVQPS